MSGPVHMNQVVFQAPSVEKIQQPEHQLNDQGQRQASAEELAKTRERTETVQQTEEPDRSKETDPDGAGPRDRERKRKKKQEETLEAARPEKPADDSGRIVDIVV